ncbi:hypothetical protein [Streptomyces sp. V1I1]|uniref:hypothetical protein n=1 Tax=Streptomyces sp. V1I1 TaxID=3042272 RepID=UPI0027816FAF|nr:hypothetical protein [Streptomyces sp. V1I1]MDQ0944743.1 cysteine synthase [Streptomyces sp. V1I1]
MIAATGGAVAVAGAYFGRLLGLAFTAVVPAKTPAEMPAAEQHPVPEWIVTGAGTGATSAAVGGHLRRPPDRELMRDGRWSV